MAKKTSRRAKKTSKQEPAPPPRTSFLELFLRFWITLGLVAVILYAGLLAISRTEGFRYLLAEHLETELGLPVRIGDSRFDWDLNLRLMHLEGAEDLRVEPRKRKPDPVGRLTAKSLYLKWKFQWEGYRPVPKLLYLVAEGVGVDLVESMSGVWQPAFLTPVASLPDEVDLERLHDSLDTFLDRFEMSDVAVEGKAVPALIPFTLRDAEFRWIRRNGKFWAGGKNVSLRVAPLQVTGRDMAHYKFSSGAILLPGEKQLPDLSFEVMHSDEGLLVLEEGLASLKSSSAKSKLDAPASPVRPPPEQQKPLSGTAQGTRPAETKSPEPVDPLQESIRRALKEAVQN